MGGGGRERGREGLSRARVSKFGRRKHDRGRTVGSGDAIRPRALGCVLSLGVVRTRHAGGALRPTHTYTHTHTQYTHVDTTPPPRTDTPSDGAPPPTPAGPTRLRATLEHRSRVFSSRRAASTCSLPPPWFLLSRGSPRRVLRGGHPTPQACASGPFLGATAPLSGFRGGEHRSPSWLVSRWACHLVDDGRKVERTRGTGCEESVSLHTVHSCASCSGRGSKVCNWQERGGLQKRLD